MIYVLGLQWKVNNAGDISRYKDSRKESLGNARNKNDVTEMRFIRRLDIATGEKNQ